MRGSVSTVTEDETWSKSVVKKKSLELPMKEYDVAMETRFELRVAPSFL